MNIFTLIPARSGSKGVVDKNILELGGLSLIERAVLFSSFIGIQTTIVSTDSKLYLEKGVRAGATKTSLRPIELAKDDASTYDVLIYEWKKIEISNRVDYDYCLLLEPTSPFRRTTDVCSLIDNTIKHSA